MDDHNYSLQPNPGYAAGLAPTHSGLFTVGDVGIRARMGLNAKSEAYKEFLRARGLDPSCFEEPRRPVIRESELLLLASPSTSPSSSSSSSTSPSSNATFIELDESILEDDLKCPVCLGILDTTYTVMACLHRFCSECLHRSLRIELAPGKSSHECPSCRAKVRSQHFNCRTTSNLWHIYLLSFFKNIEYS